MHTAVIDTVKPATFTHTHTHTSNQRCASWTRCFLCVAVQWAPVEVGSDAFLPTLAFSTAVLDTNLDPVRKRVQEDLGIDLCKEPACLLLFFF